MNITDYFLQLENLAIEYIAPQVEIIEVQVEKGFHATAEGLDEEEFL